MNLIDSISGNINYAAKMGDYCVVKVLTNPFAAKKFLQLSTKVYAVHDLLFKTELSNSPLANVMKGTVEILDFYGTYNSIKFWVNLFSKESLDDKALKESIESSLCASHKKKNEITEQRKIADAVFKAVMSKKAYYSRGEVYDALGASLKSEGYSSHKAKQIADRVIVQQKSRSVVQLVYMGCFTVAGLAGNAMTLKKWGILDVSQLAASMGGQSRVFIWIVNTGVETVLGTIATAGMILLVGEATYHVVQAGMKRYHAVTREDKQAASQELRNAGLDLLSRSVDLGTAIVPLFITVNPVGMAVAVAVAKGTGLICILVR